MKRLFILLLFISSLGYSQSNLVFNRVINFRLMPGNGTVTPAQTATVPDGKVWKIESYDRDGAGSISIGFEIQNPEYGSTITFGSYSTTPIWLQEGTILKAPSDGIFFSVLEFDVVPVSTGSGSGSGGGGVSSDGFVFSSVINLEFNGNSGSQGADGFNTVGVITVPEGKIWKVVSASGYSSAGPNIAGYIKIAGNLFNTSKVTGDTEYNWGLFLNSGTYEVYSSSFSTSFSINRTTLNILEYEN